MADAWFVDGRMIQMADWRVATRADVMKCVGQMAAKVAREYSGYIETCDLEHEGLIICATRSEEVQGYVDNGQYNYLNRMLWCRMMDLCRKLKVARELIASQMEPQDA